MVKSSSRRLTGGDEERASYRYARKRSRYHCPFSGWSECRTYHVNDYGKFALHTLPSGVFYDHTTSIIGNGVALDIPRLFGEVQQIVKQGVPQPKLLVSDKSTDRDVLSQNFDAYEEERLGGKSFGSQNQDCAVLFR